MGYMKGIITYTLYSIVGKHTGRKVWKFVAMFTNQKISIQKYTNNC